MPAKKTTTDGATYEGFTEEERAAMKERAKEMKKSAARRGAKAAEADGEADLLAKIAEMTDADRALAERLHKLVMTTAPELTPKTWYGMPAYAKDGKLICFFQPAQKFKSRYATFGFDANAKLDEGNMWPASYALTKLTAAEEKKLAALIKRAAS